MINFGKEHLIPVGATRLVDSRTYGLYTMRCVATINWFPDTILTQQEFSRWNDVYHPRNLGVAYQFVTSSDVRVDDKFTSLLFALESDNADWYENNSQCEYVLKVRRKTKLPVRITAKELTKFLTNSQKFIVDHL